MRGKVFALLMALAVIVAAGTAQAEIMGILDVSATQLVPCSMIITPVNFGAVPLSNWNFATGDIEVTCTDTMYYVITLDVGQNVLPFTEPRIMVDADMLYSVEYDLCQDSGCMTLWGDEGMTNFGMGLGDTGNGTAQSHPVYARQYTALGIPDGTVVSDQVTVTVSY